MKFSDLFIPKWKHPDKQIRATAVTRLTDQAKLEQVVMNEKEHDIRCSALHKLTNQRVLLDIALHDPDESVRYIAATAMRDKHSLYKLIQSERSDWVREAAFINLTDEKLRMELVKNDNTLLTIYQKLCRHNYVEINSELDMTDISTVYTLSCTKCGHSVKTAYPNQYK